MGSGIESEEIFKTLGPILKKIVCDGTASIQARQAVSIKCLFARQGRGQVLTSSLLCNPELKVTTLVKTRNVDVCFEGCIAVFTGLKSST